MGTRGQSEGSCWEPVLWEFIRGVLGGCEVIFLHCPRQGLRAHEKPPSPEERTFVSANGAKKDYGDESR